MPTRITAQTVRVLFQAPAKSLIGDVDKRDQPARDDHMRHLAPLLVAEVGAGRIVAAAVKQSDVALLALPRLAIISSKRIGGSRGRNRRIRPSAARPRE